MDKSNSDERPTCVARTFMPSGDSGSAYISPAMSTNVTWMLASEPEADQTVVNTRGSSWPVFVGNFRAPNRTFRQVKGTLDTLSPRGF